MDTNSVHDFQHPLEWSSILHKNANGCATSVSNLVLLRSVVVGCWTGLAATIRVTPDSGGLLGKSYAAEETRRLQMFFQEYAEINP